MKPWKLLLVAALPIWSAACASLPGVSIVARPPTDSPAPRLPPPAACLASTAEPTPRDLPSLPPETAAPGPQQNTLAWWRGAALYFESRARRAEITQSFAANVAEDERLARTENAVNQQACATQLRERDAAEAPVG